MHPGTPEAKFQYNSGLLRLTDQNINMWIKREVIKTIKEQEEL